jgi:NADH dehydrogenase (ubiquinone) 1 alpha subcomplex subunit 5
MSSAAVASSYKSNSVSIARPSVFVTRTRVQPLHTSVCVRAESSVPAQPKTATGMAGYPVVANAVDVLSALYRKTLEDMQALPAEAAYAKHLKSLTEFRLKVVEESSDNRDTIEDIIDCGQMEELIEQAEQELQVLDMMLGKSSNCCMYGVVVVVVIVAVVVVACCYLHRYSPNSILSYPSRSNLSYSEQLRNHGKWQTLMISLLLMKMTSR